MDINPGQMLAAADSASELLKSLANRHRLLILCRLSEGECSVGDLAAFLGLRDLTTSQHLALLRREGLIRSRRDGQTIWYSLTSVPAQRVLEALFEVFCTAPSADDPLPDMKRRRGPSRNQSQNKK